MANRAKKIYKHTMTEASSDDRAKFFKEMRDFLKAMRHESTNRSAVHFVDFKTGELLETKVLGKTEEV